MSVSKKFFIGFSLPTEANLFVKTVATDLHQQYGGENALDKYPAHTTLKLPFVSMESNKGFLIEYLEKFFKGRMPIPVELCGFGHFNIGVIYVDVLQYDKRLTDLQRELCDSLQQGLPWKIAFNAIEPNGIPHIAVVKHGVDDRFRHMFHYVRNKYTNSLYTELSQICLFEKDVPGYEWHIAHTFTLNA